MRESLKKRAIMLLEKWKKIGGKTTFYTCKHCSKKIETRIPTVDLCSNKGYWDNATTCLECGELNFICVYPSGRTRVTKLQ